jgi:pimeloyl-ACP methyl ester carboxylesterase
MRTPLAVLTILLLLAGCAPFESRFLRPPRTMWQAPERAEVLDIPADDAGTIRAWLFHPATSQSSPIPLLIIAHGRSDSMADYRELAPQLADATGSAVLVYDYRGFGASSDLNNPTRRTLIADAATVMRAAATRTDIDADRIAIMGISLGAYPASASFTDHPKTRTLVLWGAPADIKKLIADGHADLNPFSQLAASVLVPRHREPEDSLRDAGERPILIAHAQNDTIIPTDHAHRLHRAAPHATLIIDEQGTHTSISGPTLERIIEFIREHNAPKPKPVPAHDPDPDSD